MNSLPHIFSGPAAQFDTAREKNASRTNGDRFGSIAADGSFHEISRAGAGTPHISAVEIMLLRQQTDRVPYLHALRDLFGAATFRQEVHEGGWSAPMLSHFCADALQARVEVDYVTQLISRRGLRPDSPEVLHWPWPMRVYTLGRFSLVKNGEAVTFTGKSPHKPLELLQVLIALGGRDVHSSQLMQVLWPDADGRDLRKLFDNTLHRLRQIFSREDLVMLRDGKLTLDMHGCWLDVWAFESLAGRVCEGESVPFHLADEARRLYQGHFLQREAQHAWLLPYRERLRSRFHRFILAQGERLEAVEEWKSACQIYEHAIDVDSVAEIAYRRLMVCLLNLGEFAEALRVYRRCSDLLSIVLGVKPSFETEAVRVRMENR